MHKGDFVIYYSGKKTLEGQEKCQEFTALSEVTDGEIYQQTVSENFKPFRKRVKLMDQRDVSILLLIPNLESIKNKEKWDSILDMDFLKWAKKILN
ncbi:EVE domain-containing protein [Mucilaginibacter sp.]|uniref:EVE domain-containing protein n=1 Tax=Mucilaginibacter sp. TaxID=1882438 RepID=UPI003B00B43B